MPEAVGRGEQTRERLLDSAERLMAERGVDGVSLREIRLHARQRNASAMQYHFGDRTGLFRALVDRHLPRVNQITRDLHGRMVAEGREDDTARLVEVLVRPNAIYLGHDRSARDWLKLSAELAGRPERQPTEFLTELAAEGVDTANRLYRTLRRHLPRELATERLMSASLAALHICADRARLEDAADRSGQRVSLAVFGDNLVAMAHGALTAPASVSAVLVAPDG